MLHYHLPWCSYKSLGCSWVTLLRLYLGLPAFTFTHVIVPDNMCVLQFLSYIPTSHRKCCAFYSILNDPWEILRYIYQPIYLYTSMACMNCFLNVLFHYHRIVQHTIILSLFHFLDCSIISLSSDVHLLSAYLVTCYFWCRFSTWRLKASFLFEAFFLKVFIFLIGGSGRENFEDRFDGGREVGFPVWGWYDEKVRPQKHRQTFGGLHPKWTYLYCDGIHALWRSQNISTGKVTNTRFYHFYLSSSLCSRGKIVA